MIGRLLNGLASLFGAGAFAQFPAFYQQYLQRLGGRLDQTRDDLQRLMADAQTLGRSIEAYIAELQNAGTSAAAHAAKRELERLGRADEFETAYGALLQATPLERPLVFAKHWDPAIARDTFKGYEPALPATAEGLCYALAGAFVAMLILAACEGGLGGLRGRLRRRAADESPERRRAADKSLERQR